MLLLLIPILAAVGAGAALRSARRAAAAAEDAPSHPAAKERASALEDFRRRAAESPPLIPKLPTWTPDRPEADLGGGKTEAALATAGVTAAASAAGGPIAGKIAGAVAGKVLGFFTGGNGGGYTDEQLAWAARAPDGIGGTDTVITRLARAKGRDASAMKLGADGEWHRVGGLSNFGALRAGALTGGDDNVPDPDMVPSPGDWEADPSPPSGGPVEVASVPAQLVPDAVDLGATRVTAPPPAQLPPAPASTPDAFDSSPVVVFAPRPRTSRFLVADPFEE